MLRCVRCHLPTSFDEATRAFNLFVYMCDEDTQIRVLTIARLHDPTFELGRSCLCLTCQAHAVSILS